MMLGCLRYIIPIIEIVHKQCYYVTSTDYLPDNFAHKYSDIYCNWTIIDDKELAFKEAQRLKIERIMSFTCDPDVVAASYVQNMMKLPSFGPFEFMEILQNEDILHAFPAMYNFNVPLAKGYDSIDSTMSDCNWYQWPVFAKLTDSANSKGITNINSIEKLKSALEYARNLSILDYIIVEVIIEKEGCSSITDCMLVDRKVVFTSFCTQRFDPDATNIYTTAAYSWPSIHTREQKSDLVSSFEGASNAIGLLLQIFNHKKC